ncbi:adenosylhomocysteinase [Candidatus Peregrinibacteria bacterium RIFOXYA12_FULL_33_12]|nr:MAG: adenosylhomocysteinase [Candidatus Peregrinibacteria bacterium RIFOXYA12_FULL_33_12]
MSYDVKNIDLASQGKLNMVVAERNMSALMEIKKRFEKEKPFKNLRIGMALHVTKETAMLVKTLISGGAEIAITGCNPLSTQDDIAAALAQEGVNVYAHKGESKEDYYKFLRKVVEFNPHITIDDGCDLVTLIHSEYPNLISSILGGCEETTTGIIRLKAMQKDNALKYPMVAVNDNKTKHLMDNYYGTGQSTIDGILRASNILFAGKTVVVLGYGSCGKGVSMRARGLGSNVIVTEVDNFTALQAIMDGFRVMKMDDASKLGDIFITVTGDKHVINVKHIQMMKSGAILANSGHFDNEIDVAGLEKSAKSKRTVRPYFDEYVLGDNFIYLAGEGRLVNLAAAEGHPSEVMSLSFCGQALACEFLVKNKGKLSPQVYTLPPEIDDLIAGLQLKAMNIEIDELTPEQKKYLSSWQEGT